MNECSRRKTRCVKGTFLKMYVERKSETRDCCLEANATPSFVTDAIHALTARKQQSMPEMQANAWCKGLS
jgi:hypothetical protein